MSLVRELDPGIDLLALHAALPRRYPLLLESRASGGRSAGFDLLLVASGEDDLVLSADGLLRGPQAANDGFLAALARWHAHVQMPPEPDGARWPFMGGFALFLGYELAAEIEPGLQLPPHRMGLPCAVAKRTPLALIRRRDSGQIWLCGEPGANELADRVMSDDLLAQNSPVTPHQTRWRVNEDAPNRFTDAVQAALDYIRAGDVFQVNLSRAWRARSDTADAAALYAALCTSNPAPFAGSFRGDGFAVLSSSPERLVSLQGDRIDTRPIAGTRPRFPGDDDAARIRELIGHPKERAEHIMLIDLERNDLGRVAVPGSVQVDELMSIESYAHVHHIVSNVSARLRPGLGPTDLIRAVFPGGTITGCPKVRCMELIAELEGEGRGPYTGAMGYLGVDGRMDLNILIRTMALAGDELEFRAGAGIVADSNPQRELEETRAKARGLIRALGPEAAP